MEPPGMDFTVRPPNHHHPHYDRLSGASSSAVGARCPALRAAAEQRSYQLPSISAARDSASDDRVQSHAGNQNFWQSRSPQNWQPAMITPHAQDALTAGPVAPPVSSSQPACPMPASSNAPGVLTYSSSITTFPPFRPTMHPPPRLNQPYPGFGSLTSSHGNFSQSQTSTVHPPNRPVHRTNAGYAGPPASGSVPSAALPHPISAPSANPRLLGRITLFTDENSNPNSSQQAPNRLPEAYTPRIHPAQPSRRTPEPITQGAGTAANSSSRLTTASQSPPEPASTPHRSNDQPGRIINPVEIRRASTAAMGRARRSLPRYTSRPQDWLSENAVLIQRDVNLAAFAESFPGSSSDREGTTTGRVLRDHSSGKRIASRTALESLQSVDIANLPEGERTCVICYNEFGVVNPEGINEAPLRLPKCKHVFGDHCIKKWFQESNSCPYCRDKVDSEAPQIPPGRSFANFRFVTPYHLTAHRLPGYQGHDQNHLRDRDPPDVESSTQPRRSVANNTADRSSSQFSSIVSSSQSPSTRRSDTHSTTSMRTFPWNASLERWSSPVEHDRRRRNRHRVRFSPSSTRTSEFGGPTSNGTSQPSVRSSRSSRSRSPVEYTGFGMDLGSQRSLTNSPEQQYWSSSSPSNSNSSGGATSSSPPSDSIFDISIYPFQSHPVFPSDEAFRGIVSSQELALSAHEHPPRWAQMPSGLGFSTANNGSSDSYASGLGRAGSNQFTSYEQS